MSEELHTKVGIGVMILKEGQVLVALRKKSHGAGGYQFPGGHLEHLESFEECARRETREETGIEIKNVRFQFVANVTHFAPKHYVHVGITADWDSGDPIQREPDKSGKWQWYPLSNLPEPLLLFSQLHFESLKTGKTYFDSIV
jgi:8-oxo-dGTP diphosphatase